MYVERRNFNNTTYIPLDYLNGPWRTRMPGERINPAFCDFNEATNTWELPERLYGRANEANSQKIEGVENFTPLEPDDLKPEPTLVFDLQIHNSSSVLTQEPIQNARPINA